MAGHLLATENEAAAAGADEAPKRQHHPGGVPMKPLPQHVPAPQPDPVDEPFVVDERPCPGVGEVVLYRPRPSEVRRGRTEVAALVVWRHPGTRLLDLAIVYEANDVLGQERVPEAVEGERGWAWQESAYPAPVYPAEPHSESRVDNTKDVIALRQMILGAFEVPKLSILEMLDALDDRLDALESAKSVVTAKAAKAKKAAKKRR